MKNRNHKRLFALQLVLALIVGVIPNALADNEPDISAAESTKEALVESQLEESPAIAPPTQSISELDEAVEDSEVETDDEAPTSMDGETLTRTDNGGTAMPETDENGYSKVDGLAQGLYLLVETRVPENVTSTTPPLLVSLPMTTVDGSDWNYDLTIYPKNETGTPTLEKTVRESKADTGKNAGKTDDITDGYNHTATASDGDVVEYQVISNLPTITSPATALTTYTFVDNLSKGIQYNKNDVKIEFFRDTACTDRVAVWTEQDGKFTASYTDYSSESGSTMTIPMTADGLSEINAATTVYDPATSLLRGYSNLTMRITYACTVNSDASTVYDKTTLPNACSQKFCAF